MAVTVPCSIPVGTKLMPAAASLFPTSSGVSGVAMSMSPTGFPKQRVADRSADEARLAERLHQLARRARVHPGLGIETRHGAESLCAKFTSIEAVAPHI